MQYTELGTGDEESVVEVGLLEDKKPTMNSYSANFHL